MSDDDLSLVNEDDDLVLVNDETSDARRNDDEYRLQSDGGPVGLRFVPETSQTGTYSLRSDVLVSTPSQINAQRRSVNDAPSLSSSSSNSGDIYGISQSSLIAEQSSQSYSDVKSRNYQGSSRSVSTSNDREFSLEEIYERKRQERAEQEEKTGKRIKRTQLPEHPFWDGLLMPFVSFQTIFRLALVSAAAFIPLMAATFFFTRTLSTQAQVMLENQQGLSALLAFLSCIWQDKIIFLMLCFLWGVFSTPYSFHIFSETASGVDKFDEWPEYSFLGGLGQFLWVSTLIALGGLPGAAIFSLFGLQPIVGFAFSAVILAPIFFLSCMQTETLFTLITKDVAKSLKRIHKCWGEFFGVSFALLFGTIGLTLSALWFDVHNYVVPNIGESRDLRATAITAAFLSMLLSFIPALYLRLLGRLAWAIEDDVRKRAEENGENLEIEEFDSYENEE